MFKRLATTRLIGGGSRGQTLVLPFLLCAWLASIRAMAANAQNAGGKQPLKKRRGCGPAAASVGGRRADACQYGIGRLPLNRIDRSYFPVAAAGAFGA